MDFCSQVPKQQWGGGGGGNSRRIREVRVLASVLVPVLVRTTNDGRTLRNRS